MKPFIQSYAKFVQKMAAGHPERLPETGSVPEGLTEEFNVGYSGRDGNALYTDIYRPKASPEEKLPVIVLIHGGGLFVGLPIMEKKAAEYYAGKGYLVFVPSYRYMTEADAPGEISDICAAFDFVKSRLEEYGGDPGRVFVIAESAGAFLAEYAIAMMKSEKLRGVLGCEPPDMDVKAVAFVSGMFYTNRRDYIGRLYSSGIFGERRMDDEFMKYMDPENEEVIKNLPPAILTTSRSDFLRSYTLRFAEALERIGADHRLLYYAEKNSELGHAYPTISAELPESMEVNDKIDKWFRGERV